MSTIPRLTNGMPLNEQNLDPIVNTLNDLQGRFRPHLLVGLNSYREIQTSGMYHININDPHRPPGMQEGSDNYNVIAVMHHTVWGTFYAADYRSNKRWTASMIGGAWSDWTEYSASSGAGNGGAVGTRIIPVTAATTNQPTGLRLNDLILNTSIVNLSIRGTTTTGAVSVPPGGMRRVATLTGTGANQWTTADAGTIRGQQGQAGSNGARGRRIFTWNTASNITNISQISGLEAGDIILNSGTATRTILGVSATVGTLISVTSATAGSNAGNIRGAQGFTGPQGPPGSGGGGLSIHNFFCSSGGSWISVPHGMPIFVKMQVMFSSGSAFDVALSFDSSGSAQGSFMNSWGDHLIIWGGYSGSSLSFSFSGSGNAWGTPQAINGMLVHAPI